MGVTFYAPRAPLEEVCCDCCPPDPKCGYKERVGTIDASGSTAQVMLELLGVPIPEDGVLSGTIPCAKAAQLLERIRYLRDSRSARSAAWNLAGLPEHSQDELVVWAGVARDPISLCGGRSDRDVLRWLDAFEHLFRTAQQHESDIEFD